MTELICPDCGEHNREDALCCAMCQRMFRKEGQPVGAPMPPPPRPAMPPQAEIEQALRELSDSLIESAPSWRSIQFAVFFLPQGMDCQLVNPDNPEAQIQPTPRVTSALERLGDVKLRWGHEWRSLLFEMKLEANGEWTCRTTPNFDGA